MATRAEALHARALTLGLRMTPQRVVLLRALGESRSHPTADELYRLVRRALPTVSPATVYRNLQELVGAGLIGMLEQAGGAVRYDAVPDDHHHFICTRCGGVTDVYLRRLDFGLDRAKTSRLPGRVERADVQLRGLCAACARA